MAEQDQKPKLRNVDDVVANIINNKYGWKECQIRADYEKLQQSLNEKWQKDFTPWYNNTYLPQAIEQRLQPFYAEMARQDERIAQIRDAKPGDVIPSFMGSRTKIPRDVTPQELEEIKSNALNWIGGGTASLTEDVLRYHRAAALEEIRREEGQISSRAIDAFNNEFITPIQNTMNRVTGLGDELFAQKLQEEKALSDTLGAFYSEIDTSDMTRFPELNSYQRQIDNIYKEINRRSKEDPESLARYLPEYDRQVREITAESELAAKAMEDRLAAFFDPTFMGTPEDIDRVRNTFGTSFMNYLSEANKNKPAPGPGQPPAISPPTIQPSNPSQPTAPSGQTPATGSSTSPAAPATPGSSQAPATPTTPASPPQSISATKAPNVVRAPTRTASDLVGRATVVESPQQSGLIGGAGLLGYTPTMNNPANNVGLLMNQNPQLYSFGAPGVRLPGQG